MRNLKDIHLFYEANLEGYVRKDVIKVTEFFLSLMGFDCGNAGRIAKENFNQLKEFICFEWLGADEIRIRPLKPEPEEKIKKESFDENSIMPYGKHKGQKLLDIDWNYFIWLDENNRCSEYIKRFVSWRKKQFKST